MTKYPHFLVLGIFILLIFMTGFSSVSEAREKHALIIANKDYIHGGSLTNPIKDSKVLAKTLRDAGFTVTIRENLGYRQMRAAISEFGLQHSDTDNVALVYYSGHGAEFNGVNYLIPVDAGLDDARKARQEAMTLSDVQNFMYREISDEEKAKGKAAKGLNIIVLDACRNNPYPATTRSRNRGLGKVEGASGTMIWYAAQPGARASDGANEDLSPFAASFVEAIRNSKGEAVEDTFKEIVSLTLRKTEGIQEPWQAGNIRGRFSFTPGRGRNGVYRYMKDYDPAQLDQLQESIVPRPKEWTSVRKTIGDWKFGSMGKYFGDAFISFGGLWQETGSSKMPYVVLEPIRHTNLLVTGRQVFSLPDSSKKPGNKPVAVLKLVFSNVLPKKSPKILFKEKYEPSTRYSAPIAQKGSSLCFNESLLLGCQYSILLTEKLVNLFKKNTKIFFEFTGEDNFEVPISLKHWSDVYNFHSSMNKSARLSISDVIDRERRKSVSDAFKRKQLNAENMRQCVLEYERVLHLHYDSKGNKRILKWDRKDPLFKKYLKSAYKKIKKFYEAGDRECALIYGYMQLRFNVDKRNIDTYYVDITKYPSPKYPFGNAVNRDAVRLVLEGIYQKPTLLREAMLKDIHSPRLDQAITSPQYLELANLPFVTKEQKERFKRGAKLKWEDDLEKMMWYSIYTCRKLRDENKNSKALACYQEFYDVFSSEYLEFHPVFAKGDKDEMARLEGVVACRPAQKIWTFLKNSKDVESLNKFISEHPKCAVTQSAKLRIEELQKQ